MNTKKRPFTQLRDDFAKGQHRFKMQKSWSLLVWTCCLLLCFSPRGKAATYPQHHLFTNQDAAERIPGADRLLLSEQGTVRFVSFEEGTSVSAENLSEHLKFYFPQPMGVSYDLVQTSTDEQGMTHTRYQQTYAGVSVEGAVWIVHSQNGEVRYANGTPFALELINTHHAVDEGQALDNALAALVEQGIEGELQVSETSLLITGMLPGITAHVLAQKVVLSLNPAGAYEAYVDAQSGEVLHVASLNRDVAMSCTTLYDGVQTINGAYNTGTSRYELEIQKNYSGNLVDLTTQPNAWSSFSSLFVNWATSEQPATSAHFAAETFLDYFGNNHGIYGYNDGTQPVILEIVSGSYDDAYFTAGPYNYSVVIQYDNASSAWSTLDIVGHELTHGILTVQPQLAYFNEFGAINESIADIGGALTEAEASGLSGNWLMGEDVFTGGLRDMSNPSSTTISGNPQPDTYRGTHWHTAAVDNGGVHTNSGVGNYWFYLLADGGTGSNDFSTPYNVTGLGQDVASTIVFDVVKNSMTSYTDYVSYSLLTEAAASSLYGASSTEKQSVIDAWTAVEIPFGQEEDLFTEKYFEPAGGGSCNVYSTSLSLQYDGSEVNAMIPDYNDQKVRDMEALGNLNFSTSTFGPFGNSAGWLNRPTSVVTADFDNDGDDDALVALSTINVSQPHLLYLFRNDGGGTWTDVTTSMNLPASYYWPINDMAFADYDQDGYLDLLVVGERLLYLWRYDASTGQYVDQTSSLPSLPITTTNWLTCSWSDVNNDQKPDFLVSGEASGVGVSYLLEKDPFGAFVSMPNNIPSSYIIRSVSWADMDRDFDMDMVVGTENNQFQYFKNPHSGTNTVWDPVIIDVNNTINDTKITAVGDYDNDGDLDIYASPSGNFGINQLFENDGSGNFTELVLADVANDIDLPNGAVWEDMNHDGFLDLVLANWIDGTSGHPNMRCPGDVIYENNAAATSANHWFIVNPISTVSNKNAYGAIMHLGYGSGPAKRDYVDYVTCKSGYSSQSSSRIHFGMGAFAQTNYVHVGWPSGVHQVSTLLDADQMIDVVEGQPYVQDVETCYGAGAVITPQFITSGLYAEFRYYDEYMNYLGSGTSFTTSPIYQESTFYVSIYDASLPAAIGPESPKVPLTVRLKSAPDLVINNGNATATGPTTLNIDPSLIGLFSNYQWYMDGIALSGATGPSLSVSSPGVYHLAADWTECLTIEPKTSNEVIVSDDCVNGSAYTSYNKTYATGGVYHFTSSTTLSSTSGYVFDGTFYVDPGVTLNLQNTSLLMTSCSEIIVSAGTLSSQGGRLLVDNTLIEGCGLWKGITVVGSPSVSLRGSTSEHGSLTTSMGTRISDAELAVYSLEGGILDLHDTELSLNRTHVAATDYLFSHGAIMDHIAFSRPLRGTDVYNGLCGPATLPAYVDPSLNKMVYFENVDGIYIDYSGFNGVPIPGEDDPMRHGIQAENCQTLYVTNTTFDGHFTDASHFSNCTDVLWNSCQVTGDLSHGIWGTQLEQLLVESSIFGSSTTGPMENGIYLESSDQVTVQLNSFVNLGYGLTTPMEEQVGIGMQFYNSSTTMSSNLVEQNLFDGIKVGLVIAPEVYPFNSDVTANQSTNFIDLTYSCNKFWNNRIGVAGSGNLADQGDLSFTDAANMFYDGSLSNQANSEWDIFWQGTLGYVPSYYHGTYSPPNSGSLSFPMYTVNGTSQFSNDKFINLSGASMSCWGTWKKNPIGLDEVTSKALELYPNPSNNLVFIQGDLQGLGTVTVLNGIGQTVAVYNAASLAQGLNVAQLAAGVYQVVIEVENQPSQVHKVVVQH